MSGQAGCRKIGKIFLVLGQQGFLGRRIHSAVVRSGVAPRSIRRVDRGVVRPAAGRQDLERSSMRAARKRASGNELHGSIEAGPRPPFTLVTGRV